jgi:predicted ATPase
VSIGFSLLYTASLLLWVGRWELASEALEKLLAHTDRHGLVPFHTIGLCLKARLALGRGEVPGTGARLRVYLETLYTYRHEILPVVFTADLAEGLMMSGDWVKALATVDEALAPGVADARGGRAGLAFHTPELLRIKARLLASQSQAPPAEVEACLVRALEIARHQSALTWELRAATDLAMLWRDAQRREAARSLLTGVYDRFTEGFETPDLVAARTLLLELR